MDRSRRTALANASAAGIVAIGSALCPWKASAAPSDLSIVVPFPPGASAFSVSARLLADAWPARRSQHVSIDHRPGASGTIGMSYLAAARPDGQTIGIGSVSTLAVMPAVKSPMVRYDPIDSFTPIAMVAEAPMILAVSTRLDIGSFDALLAAARARPHAYNYVSMGESGISHIAMRVIEQRTGVSLVDIPYASASAVLSDVGGGRVHLMLDQPAALRPLFAMKSIRPLVAMSRERLAAYPGLPTAREVGLDGLDLSVWSCVVGPAGMAPEHARDMNRDLQACLATPAVLQGLALMGFEARPGSDADCGRFIESQLRLWKKRAAELIPIR